MKSELRRKNSRIIIAIIMVVLLVVEISVLVYPIAYESACRNRTYPDLESKINENVMSANIAIVAVSEKQSDNMTSTSYAPGSSGVIFLREGGRYYALTANHVIAKEENTHFLVLPYGSPSFEEYREVNENVGLSSYYNHFPKLKVEYVDEKYDLAVISFEYDDELSVLIVSESLPEHGSRIALIGNPDGEKFVLNFGKITSRGVVSFVTDDSFAENQVLRHSAYSDHGSSGCVVLNEDMQIAGIEIGGGEDFLGRFRYGAMIPCDQIQEFLKEWRA
jgi:S1-C subfamily serine protease